MKYDWKIPRSEMERLIDEWIFNERDRAILKRRLLDGLRYEELAEEFCLSSQRVKAIVYRERDRLFAISNGGDAAGRIPGSFASLGISAASDTDRASG